MVKLAIEPFLLIGATTEEETLPRALRSRFLVRERLDLYSKEDLEEIARMRAKALGVEVTPDAAAALAQGSRGTPRSLLLHLRRSRDLAQVAAGHIGTGHIGTGHIGTGHAGTGQAEGARITAEVAARALELQGIDRTGLSEMDRRILRVLHEKSRPVSLRTLSDLLGENPRALQEIHEPYLLQEGYLARTYRGRAITRKGRRLLDSRTD